MIDLRFVPVLLLLAWPRGAYGQVHGLSGDAPIRRVSIPVPSAIAPIAPVSGLNPVIPTLPVGVPAEIPVVAPAGEAAPANPPSAPMTAPESLPSPDRMAATFAVPEDPKAGLDVQSAAAGRPFDGSKTEGPAAPPVPVQASESQEMILRGNQDGLESVAVSPDGKEIASGAQDRSLMIWDAATGKTLHSVHADEWVRSIAYSPDGKILATAGDEHVVLRDRVTLQPSRSVPGGMFVRFGPDGSSFITSHDGDTLLVYETGTGRLKQSIHRDYQGEYMHFMADGAISPDGRTIVAGTADWTILAWNAETGKQLFTIDHDALKSGMVHAVSFRPDGLAFASGSEDGKTRIWSAKTGRLLKTLTNPYSPKTFNAVTSLDWSPDGRSLATGSWDKIVRVWDVQSGSVRRSLQGHTELVKSVAFTPDGRRLVSAAVDKTVRIWTVGAPATRARARLFSNGLQTSSWHRMRPDEAVALIKASELKAITRWSRQEPPSAVEVNEALLDDIRAGRFFVMNEIGSLELRLVSPYLHDAGQLELAKFKAAETPAPIPEPLLSTIKRVAKGALSFLPFLALVTLAPHHVAGSFLVKGGLSLLSAAAGFPPGAWVASFFIPRSALQKTDAGIFTFVGAFFQATVVYGILLLGGAIGAVIGAVIGAMLF